MTRNTKLLIGIVMASLALFVYVAPQWVNRATAYLPESVAKRVHVPEGKFSLGLDLVGGAHLLYHADFSTLGDGVDKADAMQRTRNLVERRVNTFGVAEPVVQVSGEDRLIVEIAGVNVAEAIERIGKTPFLEFREGGTQEIPADGKIVVDQYGGWEATGLSGKQVKRASLIFAQQTGEPQVSLEFNDEGKDLFAAITRRNLGKPVAIFLDGTLKSSPVVQSEIVDGNAIISGRFTPAEAKQLVSDLNNGALPVPIKLISQQTIGATLGTTSLNNSLRAGIWGIALVALFMILFYRLPGLMSVLALGVYVLIVLASYKLLGVTLTLAGIAGFILSLGMAVDANILIFARMKEELAAGRSLAAAVHEGFRRAWLSIRDSHVTTLISAFILYVFTTSIVKGFALTLGIGVVTSLLTAIFVTRTFLGTVVGPRTQRHPWLFK